MTKVTKTPARKQEPRISQEEAIQNLSREIDEVSRAVKLNSLVHLIYTASVVSKYLEMKMRKHGQDLTRLNILYLLVGAGGSMTPTNISKRVYRSKHAISRALDVLEKDGLVERVRTSSDRRSVNVMMTWKGVRLVRKSLSDLRLAAAAVTTGLPPEDIEDVKSMSRELRKHVISLMGAAD